MIRKTDAETTDSVLLYKNESYIIRGGCYEVYKKFRNRHKENIYLRALVQYFLAKGLSIDKEKQIPIYFQGKKVGIYVPDIIVNDIIFIELKCKAYLTKDDIRQFWYYLTSSEYKVGYLINFGKTNGVEIIRRVYDTARIKH